MKCQLKFLSNCVYYYVGICRCDLISLKKIPRIGIEEFGVIVIWDVMKVLF